MAKNEKRDTERLHNLFDALAEVRAKETGILEEIRKIVAGEPTIGELLKQAEAAFMTAWTARYPGRYLWTYTKDRPQMKRLVLALGLEELTARFGRYIRNEDAFFMKARHSFGAFVASVNQHAGEQPTPTAWLASELAEGDRPIGCDHNPPCRTDVEHTRKRSNESHGRV